MCQCIVLIYIKMCAKTSSLQDIYIEKHSSKTYGIILYMYYVNVHGQLLRVHFCIRICVHVLCRHNTQGIKSTVIVRELVLVQANLHVLCKPVVAT